MRVKSALEDQIRILHHSPKEFAEAIQRILHAKLIGNMFLEEEETKRLAKLIGETNALANLMGRRRMLLEWIGYKKEHPDQPFKNAVLFMDTPVIPEVPFEEAVDELLSRPVYGDKLALGWEAVRELYLGDHAFALARTTDEHITNRVQKYIAQAMTDGTNQEAAIQGVLTSFGKKMVKDLGNYAEAYAETVYRTNANSSYNEGRMEQAKDPVVAEVIGGFIFDTFLDDVVRPNHKAAHGFIAGTNDSIWQRLQPPLGYNCRCTINFVDRYDMEDWGLILPSGEVQRGWYDSSSRTESTNIPASFAMAGPDVYKGIPFKTGGNYF